jgi:serine/threonine-protein kinase
MGEIPFPHALLPDLTLFEELGRGGNGVVYLGRKAPAGTPVAVKMLMPGASETALARLQREHQVLWTLRNPHLVAWEGFGTTPQGAHFLVMEYLDGKTLDQAMKIPGAMTLPRAVYVARQIATALQPAHDAKIVHRDLKPGNIMAFFKEGDPFFIKVFDFGLAKPVGGHHTPLTQAGSALGTVTYMAPEQVKGDPVDAQTDIYALGVILYEMVTGRVPFAAPVLFEQVNQILRLDPAPPEKSAAGEEVPEPLSELILQCLSREMAQRPASMHALVARLDKIPLAPPEEPSTELLNTMPPRTSELPGTDSLEYPAWENPTSADSLSSPQGGRNFTRIANNLDTAAPPPDTVFEIAPFAPSGSRSETQARAPGEAVHQPHLDASTLDRLGGEDIPAPLPFLDEETLSEPGPISRPPSQKKRTETLKDFSLPSEIRNLPGPLTEGGEASPDSVESQAFQSRLPTASYKNIRPPQDTAFDARPYALSGKTEIEDPDDG